MILSAISKFEMEVTHARITTTRGAAIDTIYVVNSDGEKITKKTEINKLLEGLHKAIEIKSMD
jgi:UTP:GlnB (protein PII) uridylyltransferase